jgi:N-acetyl sugar amidotransferase
VSYEVTNEAVKMVPERSSADDARSAGYRICGRCIMDVSDPEITFDDQGHCSHCLRAEEQIRNKMPAYTEGEYRLDRVASRVKHAGRGRSYDCIVGVSGGVDSTYAAYTVRKLGLRPLAVHFDNGWNSELAVQNIEQTLQRLEIPLYTHVVDWEEFRDLQLAFLRASVPDAELPTDHAIGALLHQTAARFGVRHIISGTNVSTESILPLSWTYYVSDWKYIKGIHKRFGSRPLRTYPSSSLVRYIWRILGRRIRTISLLNSIQYDRASAVDVLERELGWRNYGAKHHESIYTRFFQSYILPRKFNIDKRRAHYSSLIMSGQMTREEALVAMELPIANPRLLAEDRAYVVKKLNISDDDFESIMQAPVRSYRDYDNDSRRYAQMRSLWGRAQRLRLIPRQLGM